MIIDEKFVGQRIDKALSLMLDIPRNKIAKSNLFVNGKAVKVSYKIEKDDDITYELYEEEEISFEAQKISLDIVYEDEYLAIINKSPNMVVHPSLTARKDTLVNALLYNFSSLSDLNEEGPGIVHRLDKDTSGLIIIAKSNEAHEKLSEMFLNHEIKKTYLAILRGSFNKEHIRVESYIGRSIKDRKKMSSNTNKGRLAISIFTLLDKNDKHSLVKVEILTGRTHQIRVHAKELGFPLAGDHVYARKDDVKRQQLHSYSLEFKHPITNENMKFIAKLPKDMEEYLRKMKLGVDYARI